MTRTMRILPRVEIAGSLLFSFALLVSCSADTDTAAESEDGTMFAVVGATLIDGTGGQAIPASIVLVEGGRIKSVSRQGEIEIPVGAVVLDATGGFLVPGFIDAHAHVALGPVMMEVVDGVPSASMSADPDVPRQTLASLLAHGITTIRDPAGPAEVLVRLREQVNQGGLQGPEMKVAGEAIDQIPFPGLTEVVHTSDEIREAIRRQAAKGVDMVKLYVTLTPELLQAGIDEAHRLNLMVVGHLLATTWTDAARMGIDGILHIIPGSPELLPSGSTEELIKSMHQGTQFMIRWFELVDLESPVIQEAIQALALAEVIVDPTLVFFDVMARGDDSSVTNHPDLHLVTPSLVENWRTSFNMNLGWTAEDFIRARAAFPKMLQFTRLLHEGGVILAAGTDANNPWVVPGSSFHRELELFVEAGIPPEEVLVIATRNGARAVGLLSDRGTVELGKRADLVLLSADPYHEIQATRAIRWVMQNGRIVDREELLASLQSPSR